MDEIREVPQSTNNSSAKPIHYSIESIEDLPAKLAYIELTGRLLSNDDPDFGDVRNLLEDFYAEVRKVLLTTLINFCSDTMDDVVGRISEMVMCKLHSAIWSDDRLENPDDRNYSEKAEGLGWIKPD